jgi:hypothetical protein
MASVADSRFKQRAVIEVLVHKNENVVNIHKHLGVVYGSVQSIEALLGDELRELKRQEVQKPSSVICRVLVVLPQPTLDMLNCADAIIFTNRRITKRQLALQLSISTGSVCSIIETLGYSKVCSKWVPRSLTADHKIQRKTISFELLERFDAEGEAFLSRIITGDETWVHHFEPE